MRPQIVLILAILLSLLSGMTLHAQGSGTPPPPPPTPPPELPLDSGILLLLLAGIGYGCYVVIKKLRLSRIGS